MNLLTEFLTTLHSPPPFGGPVESGESGLCTGPWVAPDAEALHTLHNGPLVESVESGE